ncbi:MAG: LLM class flavin-dependent oxidoreductase [Stellaceae bacterium]
MPLAASACYVLLPACFLDLEFSNPNRLHLISFRLLRSREDYAMADILTGGRVIFGVGRGCHTREVETFGAPLIDQNANREMFEEGVEVLFKAFEGKPFSDQANTTRSRWRCRIAATPWRRSLCAGAGAPAGRMLAADPERLRARLRFYGEIRHQRSDRRRLGRTRRGRAAPTCKTSPVCSSTPPTGRSAVTSRPR